MRDRHFPRLCRSCQAPMARQDDSCWHCGTRWAREEEPATILRLPVRAPAVVADAPGAGSIDLDRWTNDDAAGDDRDGAVLAARGRGRP